MSFFSLLKRGWSLALCLLLPLVLAACGGGGSSGTPILTDGGSGGGGSSVSSLQIRFSTDSVDNTGSQSVVATVTAVNASGQGLSGIPIALRVDNNATYSFTSATGATTGTDGTVTANVTIGSDSTPRTITVNASATGASASRSFSVVSSRLVASDLILTVLPGSIQNSVANSATVTVTAVDGNRNALANIPVTLSVDNGGTLAPSGTATSSNGTVTGVLRIGSDQSVRALTVKAVSGTVERTQVVQVTGSKLSASGFASSVAAGSSNSIIYVLVDNTGAKMANYAYKVSGNGLPTQTGRTSTDGEFTYTYVAPSGVPSVTITAEAGGISDSRAITVTTTGVIPTPTVAVTSSSISASPNVVAVNAPGSASQNKTELRALFVGANNQPVSFVRVWFDLAGDASNVGGTIASKEAGRLLYSDSSGVARTTYAPGTRFSPKDGVTIRACWSVSDFDPATQCPNSTTVHPTAPVFETTNTLTITDDSVSVSIGTNSLVGTGASALTYTKRFAVQVVDSAGQAKAGVQVSASVDLLRYYKGYWLVPIGATTWIQGGSGTRYPLTYPSGAAVPAEAISAINTAAGPTSNDTWAATVQSGWSAGTQSLTSCDNEDLNRNGVVETFTDVYEGVSISEDQNGSAGLSPVRPALDPRKADVAVAIEGNNTTDANGIVVVKIEYPQNLGSWVDYNLLVAASGVAGTEGRANFTGVLPIPSAAISDVKSAPPFQFSPYGLQGSDAYRRQNALGQKAWLCTNPN